MRILNVKTGNVTFQMTLTYPRVCLHQTLFPEPSPNIQLNHCLSILWCLFDVVVFYLICIKFIWKNSKWENFSMKWPVEKSVKVLSWLVVGLLMWRNTSTVGCINPGQVALQCNRKETEQPQEANRTCKQHSFKASFSLNSRVMVDFLSVFPQWWCLTGDM